MSIQPSSGLASRFRALHQRDAPLLLVNAWDVLSAKVCAAAGAAAIGSTSFGVAASRGEADGEVLPLDDVLAGARAIAEAVDVPVTFDLETGRDPIGDVVAAVATAGIVGVNIEDRDPSSPTGLRAIDQQAERLAVAAASGLFLNARCDVHFGAQVDPARRHEEVVARGRAYRDAGADCLFLPGLLEPGELAAVADEVQLPLNVMAAPGMPAVDELARCGVRRVSQGGNLFLTTIGAARQQVSRYLDGDVEPPLDLLGSGVQTLPALLT